MPAAVAHDDPSSAGPANIPQPWPGVVYLAWYLTRWAVPADSETIDQWAAERVLLIEGWAEEGLLSLWVHGDDELLADEALAADADVIPSWANDRIESLLRQEKANKPDPVFDSIRSSEQATRFAMISWKCLTSMATKELDRRTGARDREIWALDNLISHWGLTLPQRVEDSLDGQGDELHGLFLWKMEKKGHTCHRRMGSALILWLYIQSLLSPAAMEAMFSLDVARCNVCAASVLSGAKEGISPAEKTSPPPRFLVLLRVLISNISEYDVLERLQLYGEDMTFSPSVLSSVEGVLDRLGSSAPDPRYFPWLNTFPESWRTTIQHTTPSFWEEVTTFIPPFDISSPSSEFDLRAWIGRALVILGDIKVTPRDICAIPSRLDSFAGDLRQLFPPFDATPALKFRSLCEEASHICWKRVTDQEIQWYISTLITHKGSDAVVVVCNNSTLSGLLSCCIHGLIIKDRRRDHSWDDDAHTHLEEAISVLLKQLAYPHEDPNLSYNSLKMRTSMELHIAYVILSIISKYTLEPNPAEVLQEVIELLSGLEVWPKSAASIIPDIFLPDLAFLAPELWVSWQANFIRYVFPDTLSLTQVPICAVPYLASHLGG